MSQAVTPALLTVPLWIMVSGSFGQSTQSTDEAIASLVAQAEAIRPMVESDAVGQMLDDVANLPTIEPRVVWYRRSPRAALTDEMYQVLPEDQRDDYQRMEFDTRRYYDTFYGTPLASMRAFDLAARAGDFKSYANKSVMDIGFGTIGQLRLLARSGARVVGVEVNPLLEVLYGFPGDRGDIDGAHGVDGSIRMAIGLWPRDTGAAVGDGFDLIISKNTLKKGYATPEVHVLRRTIDLSTTPDGYVQSLADALNPGGLIIIYNIGPGPGPTGREAGDSTDEGYLHMADIRCPFTPQQWEAVGCEVLEINVDDTTMVRRWAHAFGWDDSEVMGESAMNLTDDLFAMYTIVRKK